jgi:(1->4)-alpha-D-glucan 1-alpha-D-glucosylmutase
VADTYQGSETYNYDLVDPDNRRPVDYARLRERLRRLRERAANPETRTTLALELVLRYADGDVKLYVTHQTLLLRKKYPELFQRGDYVPMEVTRKSGRPSEHAVAFKRSHAGQSFVTVVPRFSLQLTHGTGFALGAAWEDLRLGGWPRGRWVNAFTGEVLVVDSELVPMARVFATFPVGLFFEERARTS